MRYKNDPKQMISRFTGICHTCKKEIKKGEEIIYWPSTRNAGHLVCDQADYQRSCEMMQDEDMYSHQYGGR